MLERGNVNLKPSNQQNTNVPVKSLQTLISEEVELFKRRHPTSYSSYQRACKTIPLGVASSFQSYDPFPIYFRSGQGSRLVDVDGNEYLDMCMAFGALISGHSHPILFNPQSETN